MNETADGLALTHRLPTPEEVSNAGEVATALGRVRPESGALTLAGKDGGTVQLSPAVTELIVKLLEHVAHGNMVAIVPTGAMLTTQQAADILNVSRPYLSQLLKDGEIPHIRVGSHRRVRFEDLMAYKEKRDAGRASALEKLAEMGQEFDAS
jgi:excisionase family DNA binding protein